jgi:hypothetical protein
LMKSSRRLALGLVSLIPAGVLQVRSAGAAAGRPSLPASRPLQRFVGSWRGEVIVQRAGADPTRYVQENRFAWTLGGRFLEERGTGSDGSSYAGIWSFDEKSNQYRAYYFLAPAGDVVELSHAWDESKQTFTGSAELPGQLRMLAEDRFLGPDRYQWSITLQDGKQTTLMRTQGDERRLGR